jgi:hypothetical protein
MQKTVLNCSVSWKKITLFDENIFGVENNCRVLAGATAGPAQKRMTKNCLTF